MAPRGNQVIASAHLRKHWQTRVKTWFNQPARKERRRANRLAKASAVAPRPVSGLLRPVVRCCTARYNMKVRLGRGFTLDELKAAGIAKTEARAVGIAVDYRRTNKSLESLKANTDRLKEYKSKLILFPKKLSAPKKGDASAEEMKVAAQLAGKILPLKKATVKTEVRSITDAERKVEVFRTLRRLRADKRMKGKRDKKAADEAAALK